MRQSRSASVARGFLVSICLVAPACVSTVDESQFTPVPVPSNAPPNFQWTPTTGGRSTGIGVGVVNASYVTNLDFQKIFHGCGIDVRRVGEEALRQFPASLQQDIDKALIAKGFSVTGHFSDLSSMTYGEKEKSNLVLVPKVQLSVSFDQVNPPTAVTWPHPFGDDNPEGPLRIKRLESGSVILLGGHSKYEQTGTLRIAGSISLEVFEPLAKEKLWVKDIKLVPQSRSFAIYYWSEQITNKKGEVVSVTNHPLNAYDSRGEALSKALEAIYSEIQKGFDTYFSAAEMQQVKLDADKLRKLKRY